VSYTFPGVFSPEEVKKILQAAQQTILSLYQDHMREYGGTSTIKIVR
jgi:hypothetical protein